MSSGYFPVEPGSARGRDLQEIVSKLETFISLMRGDCTDNVPEDALADGQYIGELSVALTLIRGAINHQR